MDSGFEYALNEYFRIKGCLLQWKGYLKSQSSIFLKYAVMNASTYREYWIKL